MIAVGRVPGWVAHFRESHLQRPLMLISSRGATAQLWVMSELFSRPALLPAKFVHNEATRGITLFIIVAATSTSPAQSCARLRCNKAITYVVDK